mmetsp:Transcript_37251/g.6664  ORF Transcript_37251/g.6664 Transcript_37251/m.6664 type:complete len:92 (-) Transcript_37251:159-434(-)
MANRWLTLFIEVLLVYALLEIFDEGVIAALLSVLIAMPLCPILAIALYLPSSKMRFFKFIFAFVLTICVITLCFTLIVVLTSDVDEDNDND